MVGKGFHEKNDGTAPRQRLEEQQWYIECLREEIQMEQKRAERDLEREQARLRQQHTEIKQWILQEKDRLAAHREKGTLDSEVQTDLKLPIGFLDQMTEERGSAEKDHPSLLMGDRKRVVHEELLKHHALRRAENRVRRKRLHYQLEKIARKRHLLEAKRELQRMENEFLKEGDDVTSPEMGSPLKNRGRQMTLRRHSFSADLLSRLYPQHTPIFSQFLKRNRSSDCTASPAKSDEYLQDQKIRRRSNTMPSRYDQESSWNSFSESLKNTLKDAAEATKAKTASSRQLVNKSDQDEHCLEPDTKTTINILPIIKQKNSMRGAKTVSQGGNKGLETIRKVFSHSVGSGIKTALAKVFRKPPSGSRGQRSVKSVNKETSIFNEKQRKSRTVKEKKQEGSPIKSTVSYESLKQLDSKKYKKQRHWRSAEVLTNTKQWVVRQETAAGWEEQSGENDLNGSSDSDSICSLDSLSSAYATALAERLQQEEYDSSEAESQDSQMSQDSLVVEKNGKHVNFRSVLRFRKVPSHLIFHPLAESCSSQTTGDKEMKISKFLPAEVFWSLNGSQKLKKGNDQGMAKESSSMFTLASESRPCSNASIREAENALALTDAWSSTDAADSPRTIRASGHLLKHDSHTLTESRRFQSSGSFNLSDNTNVLESHSSPRSDSTQDENTTLEAHYDSSFENTLLLDGREQERVFKAMTTNTEPTVKHKASPDGVACVNRPTIELEPLKPNVTEVLMISSSSKCRDISTDTIVLNCSSDNSSEEEMHVNEEKVILCPMCCEDSYLNSDLDLTNGTINNNQVAQSLIGSNNNTSNASGNARCDEEKNNFYTKACIGTAYKRDARNDALTFGQSEKHDANVCCDLQLRNCEMKGNLLLPKKNDAQDAFLAIHMQSTTNVSVYENVLSTLEVSDQNKEIKSTTLTTNAQKEIISKNHTNIFQSDSSVCKNVLAQKNSSGLKSCESYEIKSNNIDRNDCVPNMERNGFNNRYFQMSDSTINDKISEVVKEHLTMSLREDHLFPNQDDSKSKDHEFDYQRIPDGQGKDNISNLFSDMAESENTMDKKHVSLKNRRELQHSSILQDQNILKSDGTEDHDLSEKRAGQESLKCGCIADNMDSVLYCAMEAQSIDSNESLLSCIKETTIGVNTSRENIIICTQLRKDYTDASNPIQNKHHISEENIEGGKVPVLKPTLPSVYEQATSSLKLISGLEKAKKVNQCTYLNAQMVHSKTEVDEMESTSMEMHKFDDKSSTHGHTRLLNQISASVKSNNSNIPPVSLPTEGTGRDMADMCQQMLEDTAVMFPYSEEQNKKTCMPNSTVSSMEPNHSEVDDCCSVPEAQSLSKLAFYEFGPGHLGRYHGCVSPDKICAKHSLENLTTSNSSSSSDKAKVKSLENIYSGYSGDLIKEHAASDLSHQTTQKPQMQNGSKTCGIEQADKHLLSENQAFCTINSLKTVTKSQSSDSCIKETQVCDSQPVKRQDQCIPKGYQSSHQSACTQRRESEKYVANLSTAEVCHNTKKSLYSQNTKESYNRCKSTGKVKGELSTAADAPKQVVSLSNDDRRKGKQKRYRRAHFMAPPSSSTDSTPDLSLDESTKPVSHMPHTKPSSQANLPSSHGIQKNPLLGKNMTSLSLKLEEQSEERSTHHLNTGMPPSMVRGCMHKKAENETFQCQKKEMTESKVDKDITLRKNTSSENHLVCAEDPVHPFEETGSHTKDPTMHFPSSDINPFMHARTTVVVNTEVHKKQAFGSAANISCQHAHILSGSNRNMTRCCSVDNGLNIQDSPFSSHLSAYVNHKELSSTLSSNGYSRDQMSSESHLNGASYSSSGSNKQTMTALKFDSDNGESEELHHSSGQVDEIVLVYSSEYESKKHPSLSKCDHGTQTSEVSKDLKRKSRHRRSSTTTPMSKTGNYAPTTWASLQNMSEHLSDLIHNTSDLLGNIQCMRTGEKLPKYDNQKRALQASAVHSGNSQKRNCCTQTSLDIGVQTEKDSVSNNTTAHEVNVIVKVIGSDLCNVSHLDSEQAFEKIKSLPDLRPKVSKIADCQNVLIHPQKMLSLETIVPNQNCSTLEAFEHNSYKNPSKYLESERFHLKHEENQTYHRNVDLRSCFNKQIMLMDRASSPILTVKPVRCLQQRRVETTQDLTNHKTTKEQNITTKHSSNMHMMFKVHKMSKHENNVLGQDNLNVTQSKSVSSATFKNQNGLGCPCQDASDGYSNSICSHNKYVQKEKIEYSLEDRLKSKPSLSPSHLQTISLSPPSSSLGVQLASSSVEVRQSKVKEQPNFVSRLSLRSSENVIKNRDHLTQTSMQQQDDAMSLVPSECNTDILININPLAETSILGEHQWIPDDLPMHNKFTNWSGINQQPPSTYCKTSRPNGQHFTKLSTTYQQPKESERPSFIYRPQPSQKLHRRTQEIEKLRKEREQVLASVLLDPSPHLLTIELAEARLHYGQGETDTLLKMLKSGSKEVPSVCNKQELVNRHRKSIETSRKEREASLQTCHRARSLSPSKHWIPLNDERAQSQRISDLPSRRREFLQQLRQEIVETSRIPDPPRLEGQCPSDIEFLLRDYSRAREEARAEIARARDRLRERTDQEKRRLQQQALLQTVKDDLRFRTRISNSTLCSGSNLSLSSGPTSGYNSSNAALLKDMTSPLIQVNGVSELKVRTRPPIIPLQTSKAQRKWLSVQDVSLETSATRYEPESSSTPSSPPSTRQRTLSFGSPSSISTSYQDIADYTLASAISEVYLASGGDVRNLLAGKAAAGWRHQGVERGVQVFHKATPRPSAHGFLGAVELERPLTSLWSIVRDHSKTHLYHDSIKSAWTRPLDDSTQLVYLLTDMSNCQLKQPRDFCCLSTESKQDDMWVLAMQSVFEETLPRPSVDTVRGEMLPSAWILQPKQRNGREVVTVVYLLQVELGSPSIAPSLLNTVSRKQAAVIADLDSFFSLGQIRLHM